MEHILAVDPGRTSGIAIGTGDHVETQVITDASKLYRLVYGHGWDIVICEDFIANTIDEHGLYTVRLVGAVTAICSLQKFKLIIHTPGQRIPWVPKAKQLLQGQKHMIHEVDALAHLLRYKSGYDSNEPRVSIKEQLRKVM